MAAEMVHTNNVESVRSLLKRSVVGTFHKLSVKHLDAYLDELEHPFNNRDNEFASHLFKRAAHGRHRRITPVLVKGEVLSKG